MTLTITLVCFYAMLNSNTANVLRVTPILDFSQTKGPNLSSHVQALHQWKWNASVFNHYQKHSFSWSRVNFTCVFVSISLLSIISTSNEYTFSDPCHQTPTPPPHLPPTLPLEFSLKPHRVSSKGLGCPQTISFLKSKTVELTNKPIYSEKHHKH